MKSTEIATKPSEAIRLLWKDKVFLKPLSLAEVMQELEKRGYNFTLQAIDMRLKGSKYLTRKGPKGDYKYVQKYPYFEAAE
jgi:repressor of nif and glnA expression